MRPGVGKHSWHKLNADMQQNILVAAKGFLDFMEVSTYIHTYIHTYIYLDLDAKMKSSVFGNISLDTYSMGNRYTGHTYIHTYIHT